MAIKGIIFDKDGTLFNYAEVWGPVIRDYVDTVLMTFNIRNKKEARQKIYEIVGIDDRGHNYPDGFLFNHDKIVRIFFKILRFCIENHINPVKLYRLLTILLNSQSRKVITKLRQIDFSRLDDLMQRINKRGIYIGLVTNDITANTMGFMEVMGITKYVHFLRTKESNCRKKPNSESIRQFASLFGLKNEEIAVVGDSIVDMEYAHNGQVGYTVAVMTGYGKREVLEKYADVIYDRVEDLINDPVILPEGL